MHKTMDNDNNYREYKDIMTQEEYEEFIKDTTADTPALLCSVGTNTEADIVESLLRSHNIPVMKKWRNGGDLVMIYMAMSSTGADLYVPSRLLEQAKLLLDDVPAIDEAEIDGIDEDYSEFDEQRLKDRRVKALLVLLFLFVLPLAVFLLVVLWHMWW